MARVNQLIRKPRKVKKAKSDVPAGTSLLAFLTFLGFLIN